MNDKELEKRLQQLKTEIFTILRQEKDRKRILSQSGYYVANPQDMLSGQASITGPYTFNTVFQGIPTVTFGQVNHTATQDNLLITSPQSTLFLVQPYVAKWNWTQGLVDGFYLGLYPLLTPPAGVKKHTIMWRAEGKASLNRNQHIRNAWTHTYNNTQATGLTQSDIYTDKN